MFLRILRLQNCSKDSHFSKGQEINTSDSGFKPLKDSHASMWLISEVFTKKKKNKPKLQTTSCCNKD